MVKRILLVIGLLGILVNNSFAQGETKGQIVDKVIYNDTDDPRNVYWQTKQFKINNYHGQTCPIGLMDKILLKDKPIIIRGLYAYIRPFVPDTKKGFVSLSQVVKSSRNLPDNKNYIIEVNGLYSSRDFFNGEPVASYKAKILITPGGKIDVNYDIEWLKTITWYQFFYSTYLFWPEAAYKIEMASGEIKSGVYPKVSKNKRIAKGFIKKIEISTPEGIVSFTSENPVDITESTIIFFPNIFNWKTMGKKKEPIFKGLKDTVKFTIHLPVEAR